MLMEALRHLDDAELVIARLLAWEEVKDAAADSREQDVWSAVLALLVLEAARRGKGEPVDSTARAVEQRLMADVAAADELAWRRLHQAVTTYATGKAGTVAAVGPEGAVLARFPRLEAFWSELRRLLEGSPAV